MEGALLAGLKAILVRTGKYRPGDEQMSKITPTAVCDNFSRMLQNSDDRQNTLRSPQTILHKSYRHPKHIL